MFVVPKGASVAERVSAAGGVDEGLVAAYRSILTKAGLDPAFVSYAVTLPAAIELLDAVPLADPVLLYEVRRKERVRCLRYF